MIIWREKLIAACLHFVVTLLLAGAVAALIFLVWFPDPFDAMLGGSKLFLLLVGCDLALGPLISLVIYNSKKSRKELLLDYMVVGAVQLAALVYGVAVVSNSRPIYVVFSTDRLEVIAANEIEDADLAQATIAEFRSRPKWRPRFVSVEVPASGEEHNTVLFSALGGKDAPVLPKYYRPYESHLDAIRMKIQPLQALVAHHPEAQQLAASAVKELGRSEQSLGWLPVKHRRGFWTALIDFKTGYPVKYLPVDPY